jgi:hypothetical protein
LPIGDSGESPFILVAITFTFTSDPGLSEYGELVNTERGTVHSESESIVASEPYNLRYPN